MVKIIIPIVKKGNIYQLVKLTELCHSNRTLYLTIGVLRCEVVVYFIYFDRFAYDIVDH